MGLLELLRWAEGHPRIVTALAVAWVLANAWKAVPASQRAAAELRYPRLVGLVRVVLMVLSDVLGALRVVVYQVVLGRARASVTPGVDDSGTADGSNKLDNDSGAGG